MNRPLLFPLMLFVSLLVHGVLFFNLVNHRSAFTPLAEQAVQPIRVVFQHRLTPTPETSAVVPVAVPLKSKKTWAPDFEKKLQAISKSTPDKVEKVAVKERTKQQNSVPTPAVAVKEQTEPQITAVTPPAEAIQAESGFMYEEEMQHYLAKLLAHIESHKYYPRLARKRGIEGGIHVSFLLSPTGAVSAIKIKNGPKILRQAARKAIDAALPLPKPPEPLIKALLVEYRMTFVLQ